MGKRVGVKDFILDKAKAGAITADVELYARPDLLAKANKTFQKMDIVGVSETQGDWCKIKGKRTGGTWMEEGWIKAADISYDEKDIAVAVYAKPALAQTVEAKKVEELTKITTNKDFQGSVFIADLQSKIDEINGPAIPEGDIGGEEGDMEGIEGDEPEGD